MKIEYGIWHGVSGNTIDVIQFIYAERLKCLGVWNSWCVTCVRRVVSVAPMGEYFHCICIYIPRFYTNIDTTYAHTCTLTHTNTCTFALPVIVVIQSKWTAVMLVWYNKRKTTNKMRTSQPYTHARIKVKHECVLRCVRMYGASLARASFSVALSLSIGVYVCSASAFVCLSVCIYIRTYSFMSSLFGRSWFFSCSLISQQSVRSRYSCKRPSMARERYKILYQIDCIWNSWRMPWFVIVSWNIIIVSSE